MPIIGVILYYLIAIEPHRNGDLGMLGFLPFDDNYDSMLSKLELDSLFVTEIDDLEQIDCDSTILIVGDSFSWQKKGGFQNYLATLYPGWKIYSYISSSNADDKYQIFVDKLLSGGPLPRIVVLESVERNFAVDLYCLDFDFPVGDDEEKGTDTAIMDGDSESESSANDTDHIYFFKGILEYKEEFKELVLHTQEYVKKRLDIDNPVKRLKLRSDMFSCKGSEDDLYFYNLDLSGDSETVYAVSQQKLDTLFSITEQRGIMFIYVVPADKYDLYKDFAIQDPYQATSRLVNYEKYNKDPRFLNCKELLYPHLEQGEKDIYRCNDSHWSPLASQYVAREIKRRLDIQKSNKATNAL